jgi:hypothetical protein
MPINRRSNLAHAEEEDNSDGACTVACQDTQGEASKIPRQARTRLTATPHNLMATAAGVAEEVDGAVETIVVSKIVHPETDHLIQRHNLHR